jgi:hypothetical protein
MKNLKSYNEKFNPEEAPTLTKIKTDDAGGMPFPVYAIWAPNRQGYLAGMPAIEDDTNIVRDNELRYKQIKLFITEEHAQDFINTLLRNYKRQNGCIETLRKLLIVRLTPADWQKPLIYLN